MKKMALFVFLLGLTLVAVTGCESYDERGMASTVIGLNPDEPGLQDSLFVRAALTDGGKQVEMGRLSVGRTHNIDVKLLAQRIVDDRANANADLRLIARNQEIPTAPPSSYTDDLYAFRSLTGDKFDQMYVRQLMQSTREEIKHFRFAARNSRNTDLREYAGRILPVLEEHLRIAENITRLAALNINVNEPAGAERLPPYRDPYYQGDPALPHQFNEENVE